MKKIQFVLLAMLVSSFISVNAQAFKKGTSVISGGIGLGSSIANYTYGSQTPALSVQYEKGLWEAGSGVISLGGYLGIKSYKYDYTGFGSNHYTAKWKYTIVGIRSAYHYTGFDVDNLDVYGGVMLSYNNVHYSDNYSGSTVTYGSNAGFSAFAGGRYFFSQNMGAFLEAGYGVAYLNLGLSVKF